MRKPGFKKHSTRTLSRIAWPIAMASLSSLLLVNIDFVMVGRISTEALAAVGVATTVIHLLMIIANSLSFGLGTLLSMELGAGKKAEAGHTAASGMISGCALGILLCIASLAAAPVVLAFMGLEGDVLSMAVDYTMIFSFGLVFSTINYMVCATLAAHTLTRHILISSVIITLVNVIADFGLIFGKFGLPALGIRGAAWASVLATGIGMSYLLVVLAGYRSRFHLSSRIPADIVLAKTRRIVRLGASTTAEWGLWFLGIALINALLVPYGPTALAVYNVYFKIAGIFMLGTWGIRTATNVMVGRVFGAGSLVRVQFWHLRSRTAALWTLVPGVMLMLTIPEHIFAVFIAPEDLYALGNIRVVGAMIAGLMVARCFNGVTGTSLRSMGVLRYFVNSLLAAQILLAAAAWWGLKLHHLGLPAAFAANLIDECSRNLMNRWKLRTMLKT